MELPQFYKRYYDLYEGSNLAHEVMNQGDLALEFYKSIPGMYEEYRYAPDKWMMKEVLAHIIDTERVFGFRILWFSKGLEIPLEGFDENAWAKEMNIENRKWHGLINEFANLRACSIDLISALNDEMLTRKGTASNVNFTVEQMVKILIGHEMHHRNVISTRYLNR